MLTNTAFAQHVRTPACARCGGTGYVFLWSIPRVGPRVFGSAIGPHASGSCWMHDRSSPKPAVTQRLCTTYGRSSRAPISECCSRCERPFCTVGQLVLSQLFETNTPARTSAAAFTVRNCRKASYGHNTSAYHINRTHHDSTGYAD